MRVHSAEKTYCRRDPGPRALAWGDGISRQARPAPFLSFSLSLPSLSLFLSLAFIALLSFSLSLSHSSNILFNDYYA